MAGRPSAHSMRMMSILLRRGCVLCDAKHSGAGLTANAGFSRRRGAFVIGKRLSCDVCIDPARQVGAAFARPISPQTIRK